MFIPVRGATYYGKMRAREKDAHLWIVIAERRDYEDIQGGKPRDRYFLLVSVTSAPEYMDVKLFQNPYQHCLLTPGEHPFIIKPSIVKYEEAKLISYSELKARFDERRLNYHYKIEFRKFASDALLDKICDTLKTTSKVSEPVREFHRECSNRRYEP